MENTLENVASRVADIEKTIGDIAEVLNALKQALTRIPLPPDCPPYCAHEVTQEYEDELSLEDRVADIKKYIGDTGIVFHALNEALQAMVPPDCPPYCAHTSEQY